MKSAPFIIILPEVMGGGCPLANTSVQQEKSTSRPSDIRRCWRTSVTVFRAVRSSGDAAGNRSQAFLVADNVSRITDIPGSVQCVLLMETTCRRLIESVSNIISAIFISA